MAAPTIAILTYGSRGDVQPLVALGVGLRRAGYGVRLAAPARFQALAQGHQLDFVALPGDLEQLSRALGDEAGQRPVQQMWVIMRHALALARETMQQFGVAVQGADLIVHSFLTSNAGHQLAHALGIPDLAVQLFPFFVPYHTFPNVALLQPDLGPWRNRASHHVANQIYHLSNRLSYHWLRRRVPTLGPARPAWPQPGLTTPLLLAYSPLVVGPTPASAPLARAIGFLHLPAEAEAYTPPPQLAAFLEAGPPPIFVGFGSMASRHAPRMATLLLEGLGRNGQRVIVQRGWAGIATDALPAWAHAIDEVPHAWLFPRMAAVIHHGGAGTTAAALCAGVPSWVIPFTADQPFWGRRTHQLGVGPAPAPVAHVDQHALAVALSHFSAPATQRRAAQVGAALRAEQGLAAAVGVVGTML